MELTGTILPPKLPDSIPSNSKWLSGQGAGTWFSIETIIESNKYRIIRYTPQGTIDCNRIFELIDNGFTFNIEEPYEFMHVSHCSKCRIQQNKKLFVFNYKKL